MELKHIPIDQLHVAAINMRHARKAPDISDILPSVRARGILQPLLVRPNADGFEIVAGRRRYFSAKAVEAEQGSFAPIPCAVMKPGDDAAALEASLIENIARLDPDEIAQYETFARLVKEGRAVSEIAATFGITERKVKGRLALGNLLPKIKDAYRDERIDADTIRHLTMATKAQQKDWLALFESEDGNAPFGHSLKLWLFGGQSISTKVALFPLDTYRGHTVSDLLEDESYFADPDLFWELQNAAIELKAQSYREAGWSEVSVLEPGEQFAYWDHEKTPKKKGGKVFIIVSPRGEVDAHEGWLRRKDARKAQRAEGGEGDNGDAPKPATGKPQMTQGARLLGSYDSVIAFGQSRALVVWQRIIMLDGSSIQIDNLPATDTEGYAGLEDSVDYHTWALLKGVVISTVLGVGTQLSLGNQQDDLLTALRQSAQDSANQAGQQITQKNLDVQPTVKIRPGFPLRVIVHKDLMFR